MTVVGQRGAVAGGRIAKPPAFMFERPLVGGRLTDIESPTFRNMQAPLVFQLFQVLVYQFYEEKQARARGKQFERTIVMPLELLMDESVRILLNDKKLLQFLHEEKKNEVLTQGDREKLARMVGTCEWFLENEREMVMEWRLSIIAFWLARHGGNPDSHTGDLTATVRTFETTEARGPVIEAVNFEQSYAFAPPKGGVFKQPEYAHKARMPFYFNGHKQGEFGIDSREPLEPEMLVMLGNLFAEAGLRVNVDDAFTQTLRASKDRLDKIVKITKWFGEERIPAPGEKSRPKIIMDFHLEGGKIGDVKVEEGKTMIPLVFEESGVRGYLLIHNAKSLDEATLHEIGNRLGEAGIEADLTIAEKTYAMKTIPITGENIFDAARFFDEVQKALGTSKKDGRQLSGLVVRFKRERKEASGFMGRALECVKDIRKIEKPKKPKLEVIGRGNQPVESDLGVELSGLFDLGLDDVPESLVSRIEPVGVTNANADGVDAALLLFDASLEDANEAAQAIARYFGENAKELLRDGFIQIKPYGLWPQEKTEEGQAKYAEGQTVVVTEGK